MNIKRLFYCLYVLVWSSLRVCAAVLLLVPVLAVIDMVWQGEPWNRRERITADPIVCGKLSGVVYEFPRSYFPFWPEYEGKSSFDSGFVNNKKGCDANLVSVFLSMTWPGLTPADDSLIFRQGLEHEGLLVSYSPVVGRQGDLRNTLDSLMRSSSSGLVDLAKFDEGVGLYKVKGRHRVFEKDEQLFYWEGELDSLGSVGYCSWRPRKPHYYYCEMIYVFEGDVLVKVIMRPDKLMYWSQIKFSLERFLLNSKKAR
ncbi:hypothetical protein [Pseudomonas sp. X4]|uniref:hypothetical protein n=1 Tax=Pseudomonas sp. X4 TaxID=3231526 RepID=UPI0034613D5E